MELCTAGDEGSWIAAAASLLGEALDEAKAAGRGSLELCLAGGSTPSPIYRAFAALPLRGDRIGLWLGDERDVAASHPSRNDAMVAAAFATCAWEPAPRLHAWAARTEGADSPLAAGIDPWLEEACAAYASELAEAMGAEPAFDLVFLGLGEDGHAASLFPGQGILAERVRLAAPSLAPVEPWRRMSLTYPAFARARRLAVLVRGPGKAAVVARLAAGDPALPASSLGGERRLILYCPA